MLNLTQTALVFAGGSFIGCALFVFWLVRTFAKRVDAVNERTEQAIAYLQDRIPEANERTLVARIAAVEVQADKLDDAYKRLRGTVARMHREDVQPVTAGSDEAARIAHKEQLRDTARKRGILRG